MKKWLVYLLGLLTGFILSQFIAVLNKQSGYSETVGLELFKSPGDYLDYSDLEVFQLDESGCALAHVDYSAFETVFIIPDVSQKFYDDQKIAIKDNQRVQHVGTYKFKTEMGEKKTVPAVRIIDDAVLPKSDNSAVNNNHNSELTMFDEPYKTVSRKEFVVHEVLESGDALALEISHRFEEQIITSKLEVLILAEKDSHFYNNQIIKAPKGKSAVQIGNYKYQRYGYGDTKVVPVIAFK